MPLAITDDHVALAEVVADFLRRHDVADAAKGLLEGKQELLPPYWGELDGLGWLGLHLPEPLGGSGYGLPEALVVVEQFGVALAPGPLVPSVAASAVIAATAEPELAALLLPALASGQTVGCVALGGDVSVTDGAASGSAGPVIAGMLANLVVVQVGDDAAVIDLGANGVTIEDPPNLDPTRHAIRVSFDAAPATLIPGGAQALQNISRLVFAAEALGVASACTTSAAGYAKIRTQFGRPIATFQAVKHHCANMLVATELATAAVWQAGGTDAGQPEQAGYAAAIAATLALDAADLCTQLNIQVHGGIGFTWEHEAHRYLRRAAVLRAVVEPESTAVDVGRLAADGVSLDRALELPDDGQPYRAEVREFLAGITALGKEEQRAALVESGYALPHWPQPWGRAAGAVEQLVIEQELAEAGIRPPSYGITGWVILTLVQNANAEQIARWVPPAVASEVIWCQLFSEPDAGSDAAGITTRAVRVEGGWQVNGQKVWTSGAHLAGYGLATVRTDPDAPKHDGITTMVIDMHAPGVDVRPLKMPSGDSDFNEVFFDDVFVPDEDVVGLVNGGWTVARATLGNESVSLGGSGGGVTVPLSLIAGPLAQHPERLPGGTARFGRLAARTVAVEAMNLRRAHRAIAGGGPGPEGAVSKLVLTECLADAAGILGALSGPDGAFLDGPGAVSGHLTLVQRAMAIAGGTSEIKRNQIGERLLGLPRDPLISN
jgi:alkylation response protein AidB-like acyl-CoA dehydrogenase